MKLLIIAISIIMLLLPTALNYSLQQHTAQTKAIEDIQPYPVETKDFNDISLLTESAVPLGKEKQDYPIRSDDFNDKTESTLPFSREKRSSINGNNSKRNDTHTKTDKELYQDMLNYYYGTKTTHKKKHRKTTSNSKLNRTIHNSNSSLNELISNSSLIPVMIRSSRFNGTAILNNGTWFITPFNEIINKTVKDNVTTIFNNGTRYITTFNGLRSSFNGTVIFKNGNRTSKYIIHVNRSCKEGERSITVNGLVLCVPVDYD